LSKIIRQIREDPAVRIGENTYDLDREARAEERLKKILPEVEVVTSHDGSRAIPILEVLKIDAVLSRMQKEVYDHAYKKGYDEAYQKGRDEGSREGTQKAQQVTQNLARTITEAVEQREAILDEARENILNLVLQISRKVTFDAVQVDPEVTKDMIARLIDSLVDPSHLCIKVHPDHLPVLEQHIDEFIKGSHRIKELKFAPDPRVRFGGCLIETPGGDIDARLESQMEVVADAVLEPETTT